ncbi:hypothetical protein ACP3V3_02245 [Vibrio sp. PNB22_3_1]
MDVTSRLNRVGLPAASKPYSSSVSRSSRVKATTFTQTSAEFASARLLSEHPRLAVEIMDAQREYGSREYAMYLLAEMARILHVMKSVSESEQSADMRTEFARLQYMFKQRSKMQIYGREILGSDFNYKSAVRHFIYFKIPGLNLSRGRHDDEVVTLFIAGSLVSLPFNHILMESEQRETIISTFGREHLDVRFDGDGDIIVGIEDRLWRDWDREVSVSGWGFRYAKGAPISFPVQPVTSVIQDVFNLSYEDEGVEQQLDKVINAIERERDWLTQDLESSRNDLTYLLNVASVSLPNSVDVRNEILSSPRLSLSMFANAYRGPSRDNVSQLIKAVAGV